MDSLDGALEQACQRLVGQFDDGVYRKVLQAYELLHQLPMLQHNLQTHLPPWQACQLLCLNRQLLQYQPRQHLRPCLTLSHRLGPRLWMQLPLQI